MIGLVLDPFEKAIRGAFEKSDPSDLAVRRRVYRSALNALERAIQGNDKVTEAQAKTRRAKLKSLITSIEKEFAVAVPDDRSVYDAQTQAPTPQVHVDPAPQRGLSQVRAEPQFGVAKNPETISPQPEIHVSETSQSKPKKPSLAARIRTHNLRNEGKKKRWPKFIFNLVILLLLVFIAIFAARWAMNVDLRQFAASNSNDGNLEFTSRAVGSAQDKNWVTIFDPEDVSTVRVVNGGQARLSADGRASYLQIASPTPDSSTLFDVGLGILQEFTGKDALIIIRAKTVLDEKSDMAVSCSFDGLGSCSRKRFTVTPEVQDFIFEIKFQDQTPRMPGGIEIVSDIDGGSKALNIVKIQIRENNSSN